MSDKKVGRPTSNPKDSARITIRLDEESRCILDSFCEEHEINRNEAVRRAIKLLKPVPQK